MSAIILVIIIIIIILIIVTNILLIVSIDNLARLPDPSDAAIGIIYNNVISLGSYIVIFLIFLLAIYLIAGILIFYNLRRGTESNLVRYLLITGLIGTIGLLILEYHTYSEYTNLNRVLPIDIVSQNLNYFFWALIITVIVLLLSAIALFI